MLPLLVCLLSPEPDVILSCHDTAVELSAVVTCAGTVVLWSGATAVERAPFVSVFENAGPPTMRVYVVDGEAGGDSFEACLTERPGD